MAFKVVKIFQSVHIHCDDRGNSIVELFHIRIIAFAVKESCKGVTLCELQQQEDIIKQDIDGDGICEPVIRLVGHTQRHYQAQSGGKGHKKDKDKVLGLFFSAFDKADKNIRQIQGIDHIGNISQGSSLEVVILIDIEYPIIIKGQKAQCGVNSCGQKDPEFSLWEKDHYHADKNDGDKRIVHRRKHRTQGGIHRLISKVAFDMVGYGIQKEQRLGQGDIMDHTPIKVYIGLYNDRKTAKQNEKTEMVGKIFIQIHIISSFAQKHSYSHHIIAHISRYCNKKFTNKNKKSASA